MVQITFLEPDGKRHEIDAPIGRSIMQAAVNNMVPGIIAECGGSCACATCHVYVDETWQDRLPQALPLEEDLVSVVEERRDNSRLSCQIVVTAKLEGLILHLPSGQDYLP